MSVSDRGYIWLCLCGCVRVSMGVCLCVLQCKLSHLCVYTCVSELCTCVKHCMPGCVSVYRCVFLGVAVGSLGCCVHCVCLGVHVRCFWMLQCDVCACLLCVCAFPDVCTEDGALHLFACPWVYDVCFMCLPVCGAK